MKKLMIACASVAMAAVAQAASINWTITNVYSPSDSSAKVAAGTASAFLFVTANTTDVTTGITVTTLDAVRTVLASGDLSGLESLASVGKTNNALGGFTGATGMSTSFSSGSLTAFAVVIDSDDLSTAKNYFIVSDGETKTVSFSSASGAKPLAWGDQTSITQGGAWTAVAPEPTSGLLVLVGVAGLALKRKRA